MATPAPTPTKHASGITLVGPLDLAPAALPADLASALTDPDTRVSAKGIIGSFAGTGTVDDPCKTWFTDTWDAYWGFPGDIKTQ